MYFAHIDEFTKCNPTRVAPMSDIVVIKIKTQVLNNNAKEKKKSSKDMHRGYLPSLLSNFNVYSTQGF
jgi:hypothetical protein